MAKVVWNTREVEVNVKFDGVQTPMRSYQMNSEKGLTRVSLKDRFLDIMLLCFMRLPENSYFIPQNELEFTFNDVTLGETGVVKYDYYKERNMLVCWLTATEYDTTVGYLKELG